MIKKTLLLFFLFSLCFSLEAQKLAENPTSIQRDGIYLSISPAHFILGGLKLEVNKPIRPNLLVYGTPEFYSANLFNDSGRATGIGLHGGIKLGLTSGRTDQGFRWTYFQLGLEYNHFVLHTVDNIWKNTTVNGLPAYTLEKGEVKTKINRIGAHLLFGAITHSDSRVFYELAAGAAIRKSSYVYSDYSIPENLHDNKPWKYGWSGLTPLVFLKLGVILG